MARRLSSNHDARGFYDATLGLESSSYVWANSEACPEAEDGLADTNPSEGAGLPPNKARRSAMCRARERKCGGRFLDAIRFKSALQRRVQQPFLK